MNLDSVYARDSFDYLLPRIGGKTVPVYVQRLRSQPGTPMSATQLRYGSLPAVPIPSYLALAAGMQLWEEKDLSSSLALPDATALRQVRERLDKVELLLSTAREQRKRLALEKERVMLLSYLQVSPATEDKAVLLTLRRDYRYLKTTLSRFAEKLYQHDPEAAEYFLSHLRTGLYFMWIPEY